MDGSGCSAGLRVWSGRPRYQAVLHGGSFSAELRVWLGTAVGTVGKCGEDPLVQD